MTAPAPVPTATPVAIVTLGPSSEPTLAPLPSATPQPLIPPPPPPTPTPPPAPTPMPTRKPLPTHLPTEAPPPSPSPPAPVSEVPLSVLSPSPILSSSPQPSGPAFVRQAEGTVRMYFNALKHGDRTTALAQFAPGSEKDESGLAELRYVDAGTRIAWVTSRATSIGADIDVDFVTGKTEYFASYQLVEGPLGPMIHQHEVIRP
ncbi:MAG TPA: hypothetical protein VGZ00_07440 [Candidatus Baltobacteraceae bacterium]|nr:hypothetical protein [Candidatus Baltobacteraceae bacterium]